MVRIQIVECCKGAARCSSVYFKIRKEKGWFNCLWYSREKTQKSNPASNQCSADDDILFWVGTEITGKNGTFQSTEHRVQVSAGTPQRGWQRYQEAEETSSMGSSQENIKMSLFGNRRGQTQPNFLSL